VNCTNCGAAVGVDSKFCDSCGTALVSHARTPVQSYAGGAAIANPAPGNIVVVRNPGLALLLSFFFPGAGQVYNGEVGKGIAMFAGYVVSWVLIIVLIGWFGVVGIWLWSMIDAYQNSKTTVAA